MKKDGLFAIQIFLRTCLPHFEEILPRVFPLQVVLATESKESVRRASKGSLNPAWQELAAKKLLHLLFERSYRGDETHKIHTTNLLSVSPKGGKGN